MGLGLFLVPTLAGYWLLTQLHCTRYQIIRDSGYHVLFKSGIAGGTLFASAYLLTRIMDCWVPQAAKTWQSYVPVPYSESLVLTAILALLLPVLVNPFWTSEESARASARRSGDLIELLILESIENQNLLEISLKTGKSYIGLGLESGIGRQGDSDIAVVPLASGYRNNDTQELVITTNYADVIDQSWESASVPFEDFRVVIPKSEIISVRLFYAEAYELFQGTSATEDGERA